MQYLVALKIKVLGTVYTIHNLTHIKKVLFAGLIYSVYKIQVFFYRSEHRIMGPDIMCHMEDSTFNFQISDKYL